LKKDYQGKIKSIDLSIYKTRPFKKNREKNGKVFTFKLKLLREYNKKGS